MGIITGLGASTGAEGEAIPDLSSSVMFSCQLAGGTMTSSPRLDGFLVIIIKKRITLHVGLEHLPVRVNSVDNQGYENAPASADSQFLPHFKSGWPMDWNRTRLASR